MDFHRLLTVRDKYADGDESYNFERNLWEKVDKRLFALPYDPTSVTPVRRRVKVPKELEVIDVKPDDPEELKWGFAEMTEPCHVLVQQKDGITDIIFDPDNLSPTKDYICVHLPTGHVWMRTSALEVLAVEIITGDELPKRLPATKVP